MLLWLTGCIWIGEEAHLLRLDEGEPLILTDLSVQSAWDRCDPPPVDVSFGVPVAFVGRTGTVEVSLGALTLASAEIEVVARDGIGWIELVGLAPESSYEAVGLSTTAEVVATIGRAVGDGVVLDVSVPPWGFIDDDGDGFGGEDATSCQDAGLVDLGGDCEDADPTIYPTATDDCDGIDQDCDEEIDEDPSTVVYIDGDGDGAGPDASEMLGCVGEDRVAFGGDCDDSDPTQGPFEIDLSGNFIDEDCNGLLRCGVDMDEDGATLGEVELPLAAVVCPLITVEQDCDDDDPTLSPLNDEVCDGFDNDCDANVDDDDPSLVGSYLDLDGDGFGDPNNNAPCDEGIPNGEDCDDSNFDVKPGALEVCDGIDNDCTGVEEALGFGGDGVQYSTLLDAMASGPSSLTLCEDATWFDTLTFTNPLYVQAKPGVTLTGPIPLPAGVDVVFDGVILEGGTTTNGGVISAEGASLTIRGCEVRNGTASGLGGGIFISGGSLLVSNTPLVNNTAATGGAIYAENSEVSIRAVSDGIRVAGNAASERGAGVAALGGSLSILGTAADSVVFESNTASNSLQEAGEVGGAVYASGIQVVSEYTTFANNNGGLGGAVDLTDGGGMQCEFCTFESNSLYDISSGPLYSAPSTAPISISCEAGALCAPL